MLKLFILVVPFLADWKFIKIKTKSVPTTIVLLLIVQFNTHIMPCSMFGCKPFLDWQVWMSLQPKLKIILA